MVEVLLFLKQCFADFFTLFYSAGDVWRTFIMIPIGCISVYAAMRIIKRR